MFRCFLEGTHPVVLVRGQLWIDLSECLWKMQKLPLHHILLVKETAAPEHILKKKKKAVK